MSSSNVVNFSLRQNKAIERSIVFECLARLLGNEVPTDLVYVGLGSVWFVDFQMAHRDLGVQTMVSIEENEVVHKRAVFNAPYRTVEVIRGRSDEAIPYLVERSDLSGRPWIVWLDYDRAIDATRLAELKMLVERLPRNSYLLTTFSAAGRPYGSKPATRPQYLAELFGAVVPPDLSQDACREETLPLTVVALLRDSLLSHFAQIGRSGVIEPFCALSYRDSVAMATVGLALLDSGERLECLRSASWPGFQETVISLPPLTPREVAALHRLLPEGKAVITRAAVQGLGFDLEEDDVGAFVRHYLRYPSFVQTASS